ncbi:hypothetical protein PoB_005446600 [Plakobranchus ocellatus]|uniref:Uncharacterized protein n=1 Tax=Plakobranchus ocellatus TaxID=259542 RepID=A0AAV4C9H3_9GAST|nr:hypothetical protein PoB_005446600 [Plakobranchus ocellatus]
MNGFWLIIPTAGPDQGIFYKHYFSDNKRARGRPQTTIPITLNNDLKKLIATKLELTTQTDLDTLRLIAEDRPKWNALVAEIRKIAEAARSDDPASGRL